MGLYYIIYRAGRLCLQAAEPAESGSRSNLRQGAFQMHMHLDGRLNERSDRLDTRQWHRCGVQQCAPRHDSHRIKPRLLIRAQVRLAPLGGDCQQSICQSSE